MFVLISGLFWFTRLLVVMHHVFQFWDIKCFYNSALKISDSSLESVTWWEVQEKLITAQTEHMMCIHKQELTPLDVYHRILRYGITSLGNCLYSSSCQIHQLPGGHGEQVRVTAPVQRALHGGARLP